MIAPADATSKSSPAPGPLETLPPAYFALVMATGIVGIAAHLLRIAFVPETLLVLNVVFFAVLSVLFVLRALRHSAAFRSDFGDAGRGVGFFTVVAASCVLGTEVFIQAGASRVASGLFVLMYRRCRKHS
jgi:tellurite resistance protein TehA-like permease